MSRHAVVVALMLVAGRAAAAQDVVPTMRIDREVGAARSMSLEAGQNRRITDL